MKNAVAVLRSDHERRKSKIKRKKKNENKFFIVWVSRFDATHTANSCYAYSLIFPRKKKT